MDFALRSEIEAHEHTSSKLRAKIGETDEMLNKLEQARRDIVEQIKVKRVARDVEKNAINFGPADFAKFRVPMPSQYDDDDYESYLEDDLALEDVEDNVEEDN